MAKNEKQEEQAQDEGPVRVSRQDVGNRVTEVRVRLDRPVLDPNAENAVIVPEGVGASGVEDDPLGSVYDAGTADEQFARGDQDRVVTGDEPESKREVQRREDSQERGRRAARAAKGEDES